MGIIADYKAVKLHLDVLHDSAKRAGAEQERRVEATRGSLNGGMGALLENCKKYYETNQGQKLMAEAGKASATALDYFHKVQQLEVGNNHELGNLYPERFRDIKGKLGAISTDLDEYKHKGMTVQHNRF